MDVGCRHNPHLPSHDFRLYVYSYSRYTFHFGWFVDRPRIPESIRSRDPSHCCDMYDFVHYAAMRNNNSFADGLLAGSFLMLTLVTPTQMSPMRQRTQVYVWTGVIFIIFAILISFFRIKNRGTLSIRSSSVTL